MTRILSAKGSMRAQTVMWIWLLCQTGLFRPAFYDIFMTAQELAEGLDWEIDLIDFNQANTVFKTQIVGHSSCFWIDVLWKDNTLLCVV